MQTCQYSPRKDLAYFIILFLSLKKKIISALWNSKRRKKYNTEFFCYKIIQLNLLASFRQLLSSNSSGQSTLNICLNVDTLLKSMVAP